MWNKSNKSHENARLSTIVEFAGVQVADSVQYGWAGINIDFEPKILMDDSDPRSNPTMRDAVQHCLSLTFHCLSLTFHCLSLTFHCLSLTFHCLSFLFHCFSLIVQCLVLHAVCCNATSRGRFPYYTLPLSFSPPLLLASSPHLSSSLLLIPPLSSLLIVQFF